MKIWAGVTWGVAAVIAGLASQDVSVPEQASWTMSGPRLALGLSPVAAQPAVSDQSRAVTMLSEPAIIAPEPRADRATSPRGCARLGIFPGVAWAERVADRLSADRRAWQVKSYPGARHYVEFRGITRAGLDAELLRQRPALKGLVSRQARAESCL